MRLVSPTAVAFVAGLFAAAVGAPSAAAQIDYRNLDDERPVRTEDAYPAERYAFELLAPYTFDREQGGGRTHLFAPEIEYGVLRNAQIGVKVPLATSDAGAGTDWGLAGLVVHGLYNFNTETRFLPALALRTDLGLPVGALAGDNARLTLKAIATRSWGLTRVHVNVARTFGSESNLARVEPPERWFYSIAADRTFFRQSLLLVGEVGASQLVRDAPTQVTGALGIRYQWAPTLVVDLGVARRLRDVGGPDYALTFGLSHAFALGGLMPARPR